MVLSADPDKITPAEGYYYNTSASLHGFVTSGHRATYGGGGYIYELSHKQSESYKVS